MQRLQPSPSISVFCAAAPSDRPLLAQWETHLLLLQKAGHITIWSEQHIELGGAPRMQQMQDHLDQSDFIILLISAAFFADDECAVLMEQAIERAGRGKIHLIPLLLHPVAWRESPLAPFPGIPSNNRPVTRWSNRNAAFNECVRDIRRLLGLPVTAPLPHPPTPAEALRNQNRGRMLRRLRRSYSDQIRQSLQGATWLELGLAEKNDAVQNSANLLLRVSNRVEQPLSPGTSITSTYDEAEQELLILGEPGTGKSTLLLDLAQQLVTRAEDDETHPLPVILPLSSWAVKRPPLQDWIVEQLAQIYDVPHKLSEEWVREEGILPLLDGLDEMEENARPACIAAINAYHRNCMAQLVVCSRTAEYEVAAECHRLALQGAVVVQALSHEDVDAYLVQVGKPLAALRSALKKNKALHDLATTPLMLNILTLTYQGSSVRSLSTKGPILLHQVWDDYVQRMVARKGNSKRYPLEHTGAWLSYLARQIRAHNQTVFSLEHLQPDWLSVSQQQAYAWWAVRLPAIVIGILISILVSWFFLSGSLLLNGVLGGVLGGLWYESVPQKASQGRDRYRWVKRLIKRLSISTCIGLIAEFSFEFHWQIYGFSSGVVIGLSSLLLQYLLTLPFHPSTSPGKSAIQRVIHFLRAIHGPRALVVAVVMGLSIGLSSGLSMGLGDMLRYKSSDALDTVGLYFGLIDGLSLGVSYALINLALGIQNWDIHPTEGWRWTRRNLRKGLFNSRHLRITALLTCISIIFVGLSSELSSVIIALNVNLGFGESLSNALTDGLSYGLPSGFNEALSNGLSIGVSIGLSYWFILGLLQGIAQEQIEDQDRRVVNQGIRRSRRKSTIMGSIGGGAIGIIGILSTGLHFGLNNGNMVLVGLLVGLILGLGSGLLQGLIGALLIGILTGGLAVWRHYVIRLQLRHSHTFPWKAPQFLDDATARLLLRRVGGGYSFTHRLLLNYFADTETGVTLSADDLYEVVTSPTSLHSAQEIPKGEPSIPLTPSSVTEDIDTLEAEQKPQGSAETSLAPGATLTKPLPLRRRWSRRTVLIVGTVLAGVGGTIAWFAVSEERGNSPHPTPVPADSRTLLTYRGHSDAVFSVAWSPDGRRLASASADDTVRVWATSAGGIIYRGHSNWVLSVAWSPDGKRLASAGFDRTVQVWDANIGGNPLLTYQGHLSTVNSVAWSPDGQWLASASQDGTVQVWDASTGGSPLLTYRGHSNFVYSVAWSPDGKRLASASQDGTVQVWNASTGGSPLLTYQGHVDTVVAWSPDGQRLASAGTDHTVRVWDTNTGSSTPLIYRGHSAEVFSVAWSHDSKRLASASQDKTVQVWDATVGDRPLLTYRGHSAEVYSVAWEPSGKRLASAGQDKTVQVWME